MMKHIPQQFVNELMALSAYIKWRNSSDEVNERISNNYSKITSDDIRNTKNGMLFHSSSGKYVYDLNKGKMILVATQLQATPVMMTSQQYFASPEIRGV
jgi:hypothetical protein